MSRLKVLCAALLASAPLFAAEWRNLDAAHHLGGRKASSGYLRDKVVLVCRWSATNDVQLAGGSLLARLEEVWEGFRTKPFVLLGAPSGDEGATNAVRTAIDAAKASFPVYLNAGIVGREPRLAGGFTIYVADETGLVIYRGRDERLATQAVVQALTDMMSPKGERQWRKFIDYEIEHLPAHACLRLAEFKKKFPREAKDYAPALKKLAALESAKEVAALVAFARRAKDAPVFGPKDRAKAKRYRSLVEGNLERSAPLREVPDPRLAQEAKNSIADLKWIQATF